MHCMKEIKKRIYFFSLWQRSTSMIIQQYLIWLTSNSCCYCNNHFIEFDKGLSVQVIAVRKCLLNNVDCNELQIFFVIDDGKDLFCQWTYAKMSVFNFSLKRSNFHQFPLSFYQFKHLVSSRKLNCNLSFLMVDVWNGNKQFCHYILLSIPLLWFFCECVRYTRTIMEAKCSFLFIYRLHWVNSLLQHITSVEYFYQEIYQ